MRVVMIGPFGLHPKGTMRARALPLARELVAEGHRVKILMPPWHTPEKGARCWEEDGVLLEYVSLSPRIPFVWQVLTILRLIRGALAWRPNVIHCFKPKAYAGAVGSVVWIMRCLGLTRVRLVIDEDDWEGPGGWNEIAPYPFLLRIIFAWQERWGLRHNDALTVASRTLQTLVWGLGVSPCDVHYLPNGAAGRREGDGALVRRRLDLEKVPLLLLYTRFFEYDVGRVVKVFSRLAQQDLSLHFLIVGEGLFQEDEEHFYHLAVQRGLNSRLVHAGWVPEERLGDYFAAADVAVYPFDDTLVNRAKCAVKLVDLLAAGVPVVAEAVGQNVEYIRHRETGLLVPSGDTEAMVSAIEYLLARPPLRQRLGDNAARDVRERFSWRLLARKLEIAYEMALVDVR